MRRLTLVIAVLLCVSALLSACGTAKNDVTEADEFASLRDSEEEWILRGLAAYEKGEKPKDMTDFFSDNANLSYLTLYDHMFIYDAERSGDVATALFAYIYDEHGVQGLLDGEKRIEYKNDYLASMGLERGYFQSAEVEAMLSSADVRSEDEYKYVITIDDVTYYIPDFSYGDPAQYHGFLYYNTDGLYDMIEYIEGTPFADIVDSGRKYDYYVNFSAQGGYSRTNYQTGNMSLADSYSGLHEALHAMGVHHGEELWLSEGICEYFGKFMGFNPLIPAAEIQTMRLAESGYFSENAQSGDRSAIRVEKIREVFTALGGNYDSIEAFDLRLFLDAIALAEIEVGVNGTLDEVYEKINGGEYNTVGGELSYQQAGSLAAYLIDIYGMDKVAAAYVSADTEGAFGKSYEELKADWMEYLKCLKNA